VYKLSGKAVEDFRGIYDYTLGKFGEEQADRYTDSLGIFLDTLSQMPEIGQDYDAIPEVKKIAFRFHTVYYVIRVDDILIARILHQLMEPRRHW
jgi:toxin ParE1/3/4